MEARADHQVTVLDRKTLLITGGATGIGAATARLLAERDVKVCVCDVNEAAGRELANAVGCRRTCNSWNIGFRFVARPAIPKTDCAFRQVLSEPIDILGFEVRIVNIQLSQVLQPH